MHGIYKTILINIMNYNVDTLAQYWQIFMQLNCAM